MVVLELFEFGMAVVFSLGNANAGGADVGVAVLVVLMVRAVLVEEQLGIDCVGLGEGVVVVCVGCDLKLCEAGSPFDRVVCG